MCVFVVPRNGLLLLAMPDTAAFKIININVDSIQSAKEEHTNTTQEVHVVEKSCTNMDADSRVNNNVNSHNDNTNVKTITNYFLSSTNVEADKRKSTKLMQRVNNVFGNVFNGIGCFKGTFSLEL